MTIPLLPELETIQNQITPGEWVSWEDVPRDPLHDGAKVETEDGEEIASVHSPADGLLFAMSKVLLADNIRMKKQLGELRDVIKADLDSPSGLPDCGAEALAREAVAEITRILGDTE